MSYQTSGTSSFSAPCRASPCAVRKSGIIPSFRSRGARFHVAVALQTIFAEVPASNFDQCTGYFISELLSVFVISRRKLTKALGPMLPRSESFSLTGLCFCKFPPRQA
jgi:hypothetical protein